MANKKKANGFRSAIREGFALWVLCVMAISAAHAQGEKNQAYRRVEERFHNIGNVADAVKKVKQGKVSCGACAGNSRGWRGGGYSCARRTICPTP
jgi:hypothetical protein